ncbi:DNA repair protein RecN [Rubrimonas cliftonensis]|uniref:DNA repair protein RecN n=1 Tax=Rubrimonas cliftonensis TaxID=89524 RepID=A0A1H3VVF1_9RHOB|nr:DNA repair protein RecN [Rubrimonas cliftonensis]SDZ78835.1 DNA replication and repair protein RecN [Rubrimonas cliftonensis]
MLVSLAIRDIVLIEALTLDLRPGLNVLTGETGAGKSILLDALGLALGRRGRADMLRPGAAEGSVTAAFEIGDGHPAQALLRDMGIGAAEDVLILRRVLGADGRARGFVNDQRASAEAMRAISETLVEIHGQHDDRGLLNPAAHRALLDAFAGLDLGPVRAAWGALRAAEGALDAARLALAAAEAEGDFLRHAVAELDAFAPQPGEDAALDAGRRRMQAAARIREDVEKAAAELGGQGAEGAMANAARRLERAAELAGGRLDEGVAAIDRALAELAEAQAAVDAALEALEFDPLALERGEERLFALRALARKHDVGPDDLATLAEALRGRLAALETGAERLAELDAAAAAARAAYDAEAGRVGAARRAAAARLDAAMAAELPPLKMERARFLTEVSPGEPGPEGADRAAFTISTNPGAAPGPIDRIASGGELSRFLLALKVCLAARSDGVTLIFDEIDRGVGGATADAVGRRLARLAYAAQVLVVTHSPQVAARGAHHWRIEKRMAGGAMRTMVLPVAEAERTDEIARMLAGETVTDGARAAARELLAAV